MSNYLDGKKVAAWIEAELPHLVDKEHPNHVGHNPTFYRRMYEWKHGAPATVWSIDALLVRHGRHLYEIPDDYYVAGGHAKPKRKLLRHQPEVVSKALSLYAEGIGPTEIAQRLNINTKTVHNWRIRAGIPARTKAKT